MDYGLIVYPMASHNQQMLLILMMLWNRIRYTIFREFLGAAVGRD